MPKKIILLIVCAILCVMNSEEAAYADGGRIIRVGDWGSDGFLSVTGNEASGYGAEYLEKISEYTGWNYEYVTGTWNECMQRLLEGEIDIMFPAGYSDERAEQFAYSQLSCCTNFALLLTRNDNNDMYYEDFENYEGIKVGMVSGFTFNEYFKSFAAQHGFSYNEFMYDNAEQMVYDLETGVIDAMVMGALDTDNRWRLLAKCAYIPAYIITSRTNAELMSELDSAMNQINLDEPYYVSRLTEKYYGNSWGFEKELTREEAEYVRNAKTLRVVCDSQNYPFCWYDESEGIYKGMNIDYMELISKLSGLSFEYIYTNDLNEARDMVRSGGADIVAGIYIDNGLEKKYRITGSDVYTDVLQMGVYRLGNDISVTDRLKVAVHRSLTGVAHYVSGAYPHWEIIRYDSYDECLKAVADGGADLTFLDMIRLQTTSIILDSPMLGFFPGVVSILPVSMGISDESSPLLISVINKSISHISDEDKRQISMENTVYSEPNLSLASLVRYQPMVFLGVIFIVCAGVAILFILVYRSHMREKQANELREKNEELVQANSAKSEFFAHMSHDMRTPMNAVISFSDFGMKSSSLDEAVDYHSRINQAGQYLLGLINDTLDMRKIETGKFELNPEPLTSDEFITSMRNVLMPRAQEKGISLSIERRNPGPAVIMVDKLRLKQIFINLVNNAIKFTPEGGHVELTITSHKTGGNMYEITFVVRDDGIGMTEEFQRNCLYVPYEQENRVKNLTGSGLGLSIVKALVTAMGGSIECKSAPGKGTVFTVALNAEAGEDRIITSSTVETEDYGLEGKRVLICEDHPMNIQIVQMLLEDKGMLVDVAQDGKAGVTCFEGSAPGTYDAVLMDVRMPVMDGLEATAAIRALDRADAASVPVIAMTANAYEDDVRRAKEAGMDEYLVKPVDPGLLYRTLSEMINRRGGFAE